MTEECHRTGEEPLPRQDAGTAMNATRPTDPATRAPLTHTLGDAFPAHLRDLAGGGA